MKFENGEYICEECEGTGKLLIEIKSDRMRWKFCDECKGVGKITWIENILGSSKRYPVSNERCKCIYNDRMTYFMKGFAPVVIYKGDLSSLRTIDHSTTNWIVE
jgi:hypothetical protein